MRFFICLTCVVLTVGMSACAGSEASPLMSPPDTPASPSASGSSDGVVVSVESITDGFWQPVRVDGVDVDLSEGDYWEFLLRDGQLAIAGFDGCNDFGASAGPTRPPVALENGRLTNVEIASNAMACDDIVYGPFPQEGDALTLLNNGSGLRVSDGDGIRVELVRLDQIPTRRLGDTPTTGASNTSPPLTEPPFTNPP